MARVALSRAEQDRVAEKIRKVQELYADAPEVGRIALKNGMEALKHELAAATGRESAGRIGARQGHASELLFCTTYDGEWDAYIDDFVTKIPNSMDILFCNCAGWPGIRSPVIKDWLLEYQHTADAWYVSNPNLSVAQAHKLERIGKAVDELLDKIG